MCPLLGHTLRAACGCQIPLSCGISMCPLLGHTLRAACGCQIPLPTEGRVPRSAGGEGAAAVLRNLEASGPGASPEAAQAAFAVPNRIRHSLPLPRWNATGISLNQKVPAPPEGRPPARSPMNT